MINYMLCIATYPENRKVKLTMCYQKVGVCKVLPDKGLLDGLLTCRFILLFSNCCVTLFFKGMFLGFLIDNPLIKENIVLSTIITFLVFTLPGLFAGLIFIRHSAMFKTFLNHPSLLLLPVFTFFSFASNTSCSCSKKEESQKEVEISFSVKATIFNALMSLALHVGFLLQLTIQNLSLENGIFTSAFPVFTMIPFLCTMLSSCSSSPSSSCCPSLELGVYFPASPEKMFIKDKTEPDGRREITMEEQ